MNTQFHTPSFGDEIFDLGDGSTSTPSSSGFLGGNSVNNLNTTSHWYQQQQQNQQTPPSTKRMISLHNTSDEYHTANEESFNITANNSMNQSTVVQQNTNNNVLSGVGITPTATATGPPTTMAARKQMLPLNQNEPAKPLSAYALFFRDTVSAIKQQNPNCTFQELSKIVASMWEALDAVHKGVYNKKHEAARTEYLKQLKIYQQQQQLKQHELLANNNETLQTETTNSLTQVQQVAAQQPVVANNQQQNKITTPSINTATPNTANVAVAAAAAAPTDEQFNLLTEASTVQKCTRENCNKRAIINPDWEDEYCSNECVVIHCRNVFSAWVQSNLEAKQQQQQQQQQTTVNQQTTAAT